MFFVKKNIKSHKTCACLFSKSYMMHISSMNWKTVICHSRFGSDSNISLDQRGNTTQVLLYTHELRNAQWPGHQHFEMSQQVMMCICYWHSVFWTEELAIIYILCNYSQLIHMVVEIWIVCWETHAIQLNCGNWNLCVLQHAKRGLLVLHVVLMSWGN